ncbi:Holliday junction branch migration protein RuvA [Nesterenkonia massiliensis]|uniref:Holliday junction branch migration complex subunit RuvA n=1 Tax=Nesterenkonia massiliensis TaxID=1232429 RepID=A0ABT2HQT6_9MICC|nr:Holliday junction branch migration protein RuvA [Nesterenkonia massiliensis]MCT1607050.1 Holliday junction branch migration protein RuvA [Nesterenkonia massiliensis]
MISSIRGEVLKVALDHAVVEVSGFGLHVNATAQTLGQLRTGQSVRLQTSYVPRQDEAPLLFGFADESEREIFSTLLSISGVGPRLALAVLSVHTPDEVRAAIRDSDTVAFTKVPGIGKKTAQRILLELAGKLVIDEPATTTATKTAAAPTAAESTLAEVRSALTSLGWTEKDAEAAVQATLSAEPELADADTAVLLRSTLRGLGSRTGARA